MSACWQTEPIGNGAAELSVMQAADLDAVMAMEANVYAFPWSRGNFVDSLSAGYIARVLRRRSDGVLLGYFVAMAGADEMHLLNITVGPGAQRQGHARFMLAALIERCRRDAAERLWLEVRESNAGARLAYQRLGFSERGVRPGYYPAARGKRESAVVMSMVIASASPIESAASATAASSTFLNSPPTGKAMGSADALD